MDTFVKQTVHVVMHHYKMDYEEGTDIEVIGVGASASDAFKIIKAKIESCPFIYSSVRNNWFEILEQEINGKRIGMRIINGKELKEFIDTCVDLTKKQKQN